MALSGSKNYTDSITAANIIALALRRLGILDAGATIDSTEEANALIALNVMVKEWTALGLDNWLRQSCAVWLVAPGDTDAYLLGPTGSRAATAWYETEVSGGGGTGSTSLVVSAIDTTHSINGSHIGIRLDNGDIFFTTINGVPTTTITLTTGLPSTASATNRVYIYGTAYQISRPSKLLYASRITADNINVSVASAEVEGNESEVRLIGNDEYRNLSQKKQTGPTVSVYYEPTLFNGTLYVWPTGVTSQDYDKLNLIYNIYTDDFDATTNNAQFPPEWHNAIAWNLAAEMASEYGISQREQAFLWQLAHSKLNDLLDYDIENASVIFGKDYQPGVR